VSVLWRLDDAVAQRDAADLDRLEQQCQGVARTHSVEPFVPIRQSATSRPVPSR
jgi:hypothetical protein